MTEIIDKPVALDLYYKYYQYWGKYSGLKI